MTIKDGPLYVGLKALWVFLLMGGEARWGGVVYKLVEKEDLMIQLQTSTPTFNSSYLECDGCLLVEWVVGIRV